MSREPIAAPAAQTDAALSRRSLRRIVEYLAKVHGVTVDPASLDASLRRPSAETDDYQTVRALAAEFELTTALVRRPLAEVVAEADPAYPWLALRAGPNGEVEALAVLGAAGGGAIVATPGSLPKGARWTMASLRAWLGLDSDAAPVTWILAEPATPLSSMRSPEAGPVTAPIARLLALLGAERQTLWVVVVYSVVIGLLSLVVPVAVQSVVNTIAFGSALQPLVVLTIFVLVALGFSTVMNALRAGVVEIIQRSVFARVATDVTSRLLRVRADAFDRYYGPEIVNRFFDTVTVQKSAALLLIDGLSIVMQTTIGMVLLAVFHPWLLAFDVLIVVAMLTIVFGLGRGAVETSISESKAKYAFQAWLEQLAGNLITFKSAGGSAYAVLRSQRLLETYLSYRRKHFRILIRQIVGSFALQALASSALLGVGGWLVIERQLTLGQLVASELVVAGMLSAFTKFGKQLEVFYDLVAAIDKLGALVDLPLERTGGEADLPGHDPLRLSLRGVSVQYADAATPALRIEQWHVAAGDRVGVTGPNGSGKSTLADVIYGLRDVVAGSLTLNDIDIRSLPLPTLRRDVALVRGVELFPGTITDNVRLGRDLSHADVSRALAAVGLLDEVLALPDGLNTTLHPHGRPLSYRQACRLMVARALAGLPRLVVLDGALDQIDPRDEHALADLLFAPEAPWTLVCITERPDLLQRCTHVVRLEGGQVLAEPVPGHQAPASLPKESNQ